MSTPSPIAPTDQAPPAATGFTAPSVEDIQTLLPQYELLEQIGAGGMGAVYKARQPGLDRIVAIKILPTGLDDKFEFKERFRREARAMARLHHPGIISVFEFGETEPTDDEPLLYIVMEYVEGADLNYLIKTAALEVPQILAVVTQVCEALQYAHEQNIVHRDIKPANIMLNMDGNVKIADFGLAKIISTDTTVEPSLTGTNIVMGTLDYLAPEQMVSGATVDQRADLYALGVLIYEMLTGKAPRGAFELPSKKVEGLDPRLDHLILRSMATDPGDRYQDANELSTAILDIGTPEPEPEPKVEQETPPQTSPSSSAPPWTSTTAKPAPELTEQIPATQADVQAAIKTATMEASRAATQAAHVASQSQVRKAPSEFWPNLYSTIKTLMALGVATLAVIVLGLFMWLKWPQITQVLTRSSEPTTTTKQQTAQESSTLPPARSTPQKSSSSQIPTSSTTRPMPPSGFPHPPPGFPPPPGRGQRPSQKR